MSKEEINVHVLVDLSLSTVLAEEATENTHASHPHDLGGEASLLSTAALTVAHVTTLGLSLKTLVDARTRVDNVGLANNITILDELANSLA